MSLTVSHSFVSAIPDGSDTTKVRPSNWNANHTVNVTATQIVFGNGSDAGTSSDRLTWIDASNTLRLGRSTATDSARIENPARTTTGDGGGLTIQAGDGSSTENGGTLTLNGGAAGSSGSGLGGSVRINSGTPGSSGTGGEIRITVTASGTSDGNILRLASGDAGFSGGPQLGGNLELVVGIGTSLGSGGANGQLSITNTTGDYGVATGSGTITRGNVGPAALSVTKWLPIIVDGGYYYLELYS